MRDQILTVEYNRRISGGVYHMSLAGDCSEISRPGQFIDILIDDFFLRRPISIFDHDDSHVEILYRVVGAGTAALSEKSEGDVLDVLLPLGNGFDLDRHGDQNLLVAGGIGMPPIHEIAKQLASRALPSDVPCPVGISKSGLSESDCAPERASFCVLLGFRTREDIFGVESFRSLGIEPIIATEDGSFGIHGRVTDVMDMMKAGADRMADAGNMADGADLSFGYDYVYACGPEPMLKAVYSRSPDGQFSFEERMGCGFGACMGCSCETKYGYKRICKDGPVLYKNEIIW